MADMEHVELGRPPLGRPIGVHFVQDTSVDEGAAAVFEGRIHRRQRSRRQQSGNDGPVGEPMLGGRVEIGGHALKRNSQLVEVGGRQFFLQDLLEDIVVVECLALTGQLYGQRNEPAGHELRVAVGKLAPHAFQTGDTPQGGFSRESGTVYGTDRTTEHQVGDDPRFDQIEPLANELIQRFEKGEVKSVHVAYMRFISTSRQVPTVIQLLPLTTIGDDAGGDDEGGSESAASSVEYEFSPEPEALLGELLPASVRMRLFQCFSDAVVSEQVARMVAMKAATDAAGDMIKSLTRQYNRARQTHITMELLDIIGGAAAIE